MKQLLAFAAAVLTFFGGQATYAALAFTGGAADLTFFYESAADRWDVVFRRTASTVGTGFDSPYTGFTGIVGLGDDFNFNNSLTTRFTTDRFVTVGSTNYAVARASGSPFNLPSQFANNVSPDLGIRARLRENQVALGIGNNTAANQFASLGLTLDLAASTFNGSSLSDAGSPFVSLLGWDPITGAPSAMIDSASGQLTANFGNYAHIHRNWGFSRSGEYVLNFNVNGVGGTYGDTAGTGNFSMAFEVAAVPEPSTVCVFAAVFGLAGMGLRRGRRPITDTSVASV